MDRSGFKPKSTRRKLNRAQIIDILERNVALYKDDADFVHYLVELAVYLMEYEYDWSESEVAAPAAKAAGPDGNNTPVEERPPARRIFSTVNPGFLGQARKSCPYCGVAVGDLLICPSCHNLTR
jgi:hypothetical protein